MEISIIIAVAENDYGWLPHQIRQLERQRTERSFELVVGDNGGSLNLLEHAGEFSIRVVDASGTPGPGYARNVAVEGARGNLLLFCDADDLIGPDWVEHHGSLLAESGLTAGSFLSVLPGDDRWTAALEGVWPSTGFSSRIRYHEGLPFATTANLGVHRSLFERVGGFPVAYLRGEDVAFSFALRALGVVPYFVAGAQVVKVEGRRQRGASARAAYRSGCSRVRLARDFAVGPRSGALAGRGALRTVRAIPIPFRGDDRRPRSITREACELAGIVTEWVRGPAG